MGAGQQPLQRLVIGLVDGFDPRQRFGERQPAGIDVEPLADQLGTVPSPPATRAERMLAKGGTGSANMRGSSSHGSRLTSR